MITWIVLGAFYLLGALLLMGVWFWQVRRLMGWMVAYPEVFGLVSVSGELSESGIGFSINIRSRSQDTSNE
jgi:hypothetical protein